MAIKEHDHDLNDLCEEKPMTPEQCEKFKAIGRAALAAFYHLIPKDVTYILVINGMGDESHCHDMHLNGDLHSAIGDLIGAITAIDAVIDRQKEHESTVAGHA